MKKKRKGGKTGGRGKMPDELKRVRFDTRVEKQTKENIRTEARALKTSIGKYLDIIHGVKTE